MTKPQLAISTLFESPDLLVRRGWAEGQSGRPLVIFSCAHKNAISGEWLEYIGTAAQSGRPVIYVTDRRQSWYGAPGLARDVVAAVTREMAALGATEVDTLGGSMGGHGAIGFATRLPVRTAVAFVPRYSAVQSLIPDPRLRDHLAAYQATLPFRTLAEGLRAAGHAFVLHGARGLDLAHSRCFPRQPNVSHWILPRVHHDVMWQLKDRGALGRYLNAALDGDVERVGAVLRHAGARPHARMRAQLEHNFAVEFGLKAPDVPREPDVAAPGAPSAAGEVLA